jgi:serine/threonine protein phosphatase PrpC
MKISVYGETNVGLRRDHNEDAFLILGDLRKGWQEINDLQLDLADSMGLFFVVADGMGGANAGEVASALALTKVSEKVSLLRAPILEVQQIQKFLTSIVFEAHLSIVKKARNNDEMKGMGTTMVLGCIVGDSVHVVWAGDSRIYRYNPVWRTQLVPFSEDHSLVWNRVKNGEITPEEARLSDDSNLILNAIGDSFQKPVPDYKHTGLQVGDRLIVCSDGLNSMLSDSGIQQIIDFNSDPKEACKALIKAACHAGGHDNITVIVIDIMATDNIAVSAVTKKQTRKRRYWPVTVLLLLALMIVATVYFSSEIGDYLTIKGKPKSVDQLKQIHEVIPDNPAKKADIVPVKLISGDRNKKDSKENPISKTGVAPVESPAKPDPVKIRMDMEHEYLRIIEISNDVTRHKPGGDAENMIFYQANVKAFDNLTYKLDSLQTLIKSAVYAPGNKIVSVKDPEKAAKILESLKTSVDRLHDLKEDLLNHIE